MVDSSEGFEILVVFLLFPVPAIVLLVMLRRSWRRIETTAAVGYAGFWPRAGYAGFWRRYAAASIDGMILSLIIMVVKFVTLLSEAKGIWNMASLATPLVYGAIMESSSKQATLGKIAFGVAVTDSEGRGISFGRALGRNLGKFLPALILYVGFIALGRGFGGFLSAVILYIGLVIGRALGRNLGKFLLPLILCVEFTMAILILHVGFIMAGFTKKKQALHDIMASCLVVVREL